MHGHRASLSIALILIIFLAGTAAGGLLTADPNALSEYQGTAHFNNTTTKTLTVDVDYAVYPPGAFGTSALLSNPVDPSGGADYVYAYEIFNNSPSGPSGTTLSSFTVGLKTSMLPPALAVVSYATTTTQGAGIPVTSGQNPDLSYKGNHWSPTSGVANSAAWAWSTFNAVTNPNGNGVIATGQHSAILFFTWPGPPTWKTGAVLGGVGTGNSQPLPSPEPSTAVLAAIASICLLAGAYRRRRNRL